MEREIGNFYIEGYNFDTKTYDNKDNTLLLVIDLQEKLMPAIYESDRIIKNSACLLKVFEMYGIKKIATEQYPKGLGQSVDEIKENLDDENIFSKTSFDAITDEVSSYLKENKITTIFTEELIDPKVSKIIADETGCVVKVLSPIEGLSEEQIKNKEDYFSIMEENLENLVGALK